MRRFPMALIALTALTFTAPLSAQGAQSRQARVADAWWAPRGPELARSNEGRRRGNGPPFCRNGVGHPVHGMAWCEDKGWARVGWDDILFRGGDRSPFEPVLRRPSLIEVLGDVVLGRLTGHADTLGLEGDIEGQWIRGEVGPAILQLRVGDSPLAELTDMDRDDRADVVLLIDPG